MGTAKNNHCALKLPLLHKPKTPKNYAQPEVLGHTFETLSSLHRLLPNHLMETLYSYKSEEDKQNCQNSEFSGLERILARHQFPKEINVTPKPSSMPLWKRKCINNSNRGWKKCYLWNRNLEEPPMSTVSVRWLKKNMQPTEDLRSVIQRLSVFGPIKSVTLCGRQSAIVVFKDMTSACNAVNAFRSRTPGTMFQCSWQQRFMSKDVRLPMTQILCKFLKLVVRNWFVIGALVNYDNPKWYVSTEKRHSLLVQVLEIGNDSTSLPSKCIMLL